MFPPRPPAHRRLSLLLAGLGAAACAGAQMQAVAASRMPMPRRPRSGIETVTIQSGSGSALRAWLMRGIPGKGAVLLFHGIGSDRTSMLARAAFLHDDGYTVLAPDFQAQGESPGAHVTYGARESLDAAAAFKLLRDTLPNELVGVIGVSMGGAAALLGPGPLKANAFVLESVYPTIADAVSDRLESWFWPLGEVGRSLAPALIGFVGSNVGVTEAELQPIDRIGHLGAPVLMLAGTDDPYTPLAEAESLYARAAEPKMFWAIRGAKHEDFYAFSPSEYERRIGAFFAQYLRRRAPAE